MNTNTLSPSLNKSSQLSFWITTIALVIGFIFSIFSWLEICVEHCSANNNYRLFGFSFGMMGMLFFITIILFQVLSKYYSALSKWVGWMLASALGAEMVFIATQHYQIGHWCPVCLTIALCVLIAALAYSANDILAFLTIQQRQRGEIMHMIKKGLSSVSFLLLGVLLAWVGISQVNVVEAAIDDIKSRIAFGDRESPVEVYFITDWFCPSCQSIEGDIEKLLPQIQSKVGFYFIDYPIHRHSLNFTPYNLAFLMGDKSQYFKARQLLVDLTDQTETPTDSDVEKAAKKAQIPFKELSFLDIKTGLDYFDKVSKNYDISATPTIVITNTKTNKSTKFEGTDEISDEKIVEAIEKLSKS